MSLSEQFNVGKRIKARSALPNTTITQSSAAASTTQDGLTIDRNAAGLRRYYSCKAIVSGALTSNSSMAQVTFTLNFQHSSDGTSWDNYSTGTVPTNVWGTSSSGNTAASTSGGTYQTVEQSVNLNGGRRYVRIQIPAAAAFSDCSSGQSLAVHGVVVFGGADELPAQ